MATPYLIFSIFYWYIFSCLIKNSSILSSTWNTLYRIMHLFLLFSRINLTLCTWFYGITVETAINIVNRTKLPLISVLRVFLIFMQPRYRSWPHIYASIFRDYQRVVREGKCWRGRRIVHAMWRVPIPLFSAPRQAADNINVGREGAGTDAWKRRPVPGVDICASELIPPPCACMGAHGSAIRVRVCVRARDEGTGTAKGWERKWMEEGGGGMTAVSSRAGEITHFDGIKMSVFPTPICGEIARNRARYGDEQAREREKERGENLSFLTGHPYGGGKREVAFLEQRGKRGEKVSRSRLSAFLDVVQNVIL